MLTRLPGTTLAIDWVAVMDQILSGASFGLGLVLTIFTLRQLIKCLTPTEEARQEIGMENLNKVVEHFRSRLEQLVAEADRAGVVLTVEQKPLKPLAMRHYESVSSARAKRN